MPRKDLGGGHSCRGRDKGPGPGTSASSRAEHAPSNLMDGALQTALTLHSCPHVLVLYSSHSATRSLPFASPSSLKAYEYIYSYTHSSVHRNFIEECEPANLICILLNILVSQTHPRKYLIYTRCELEDRTNESCFILSTVSSWVTKTNQRPQHFLRKKGHTL